MESSGGPSAPEKGKRLPIAAGKNVLTVVDAFARDGIPERGRAPAEQGPCFEHMNGGTRLR